MELKIKITTPDEIARCVEFFAKSSLNFVPDNEEEFLVALYETIGNGYIMPSWLNNNKFEPYVNSLRSKYADDNKLDTFLDSVKGYYNDSFSSVMLKPTEHFKTFCGSESLTHYGFMSKKMALNYIMYQINLRKIKVKDDIIYMDEYLNTLFNTSLHKIRKDELIDLIDTLFI